jgi:hypothetical protein
MEEKMSIAEFLDKRCLDPKERISNSTYGYWRLNDLLQDFLDEYVADIRNKLTPCKNLCALINHLPHHIREDLMFSDLIWEEVKNSSDSIKYLSNSINYK